MKFKKKYKEFKKKWAYTRKNYIEWCSSNEIKNFCAQNCKFDGWSIWWATSLASRDNVNFPKWYIELKKNLTQRNYKFKKEKFFWLIFTIKFVKNFILKILWIIFIKSVSYKRFFSHQMQNMFHAYDYDFFKSNNNKFENKLYGLILDRYKKKNLIIVSIIKFKYFLKNYFNFYKKKNLVIADEYISLKDFVYFNIYLIKCLFKLIHLIKIKKTFVIKNKDCENILKPFLFKSFCGEIQNSYLIAKSISNFLKKNNAKSFITYGEFTPGYRIVYIYVKKQKKIPKIITLQHGQANSLFNYSKKNEFTKNYKKFEGVNYSPSPDKYFVQGYSFFNKLKKFYKGEIKIIGSPRYDNFNFAKNNNFKIEEIDNNKKNILICTSVGDEDYILELISKCANHKHNYILSAHPDNKERVIQLYKDKYKKKIKLYFFNKYNTSKLIQISDLVITSLSNSCLEAQFFAVPSIRVVNPEKPDYLDHADGIKIVCSVQELKNILNKKIFLKYKIKNLKKLEKNYFFKLDNKAHQRFWKYL